MNSINLTGRLGQDPKIITFDNGDSKSGYSIAVNDGYYDKKSSEWIDRTVWINIVQFKESKFKKGDLIEISGKISVRSYEKEEKTIYITEVIAHKVGLLERKREGVTQDREDIKITPEMEEKYSKENPDDDLPF